MVEKEVKIKVDVDKSQVDGAGISFGKLAGAIGLATSGYALLSKAVSSVTEFLKAGVKAAMDEENVQKKLLFALNGSNSALKSMLNFRDQMFKTTLFSKESINGAISMGLELGRTEEQTKKMIETAMGLSRVTGQDLNTVMLQLSGTFEGTLGRLGRYDSAIKGLTKEQYANGDAVDILNKKFGKLATEGMDTVEGRTIQAKKSWEEFGKSVGEHILPIIGALSDAFLSLGGNLDAELRQAKSNLEFYKSLKEGDESYATEKAKQEEIETAQFKIKVIQDKIKKQSLIDESKQLDLKIEKLKEQNGVNQYQQKLDDEEQARKDKKIQTDKEAAKEAVENAKQIKKIFEDSQKDIIGLDEKYKLLGGTVEDLNKEKLSLLEKELTSLLDKGVKPTSKEIINLKNEIDALKISVETSFEDLQKNLNILDEKYKLLGGTVEDLNKEKLSLLETKLDDLLQNGIDPTSDAVQVLVDRIKNLKEEITKMPSIPLTGQPSKPEDLFPKGSEFGTDIDAKKKAKKTEEEAKATMKNIESASIELASKISNTIFQNANDQIAKTLQKTLDGIDKATERSQTNLEKLNQKRFISDAEYAKRKQKLDDDKEKKETEAKKEAAKRTKKNAEEQAVINAILAAVMSLANTTLPFPTSLIGPALVLAAGLADAALIASSPLSYKAGTSKVPSFASGGFTSPFGDPTGIPATLHPNEAVLNSTAMSNTGMVNMVNQANAGQQISTTTTLHPDSINAIITGINDKKVHVVESDITNSQNRVKVLQNRSSF
jgi:hypothetical protein